MFHFDDDADRSRLLTDMGSVSRKMRELAEYMEGFDATDAVEAIKLINGLKKISAKLATIREKESSSSMW